MEKMLERKEWKDLQDNEGQREEEEGDKGEEEDEEEGEEIIHLVYQEEKLACGMLQEGRKRKRKGKPERYYISFCCAALSNRSLLSYKDNLVANQNQS